jgi:hypothetical protein
MNFNEPKRSEHRDLPRPRMVIPSVPRDESRIARARWAEVVLKMRARVKIGRIAETLAALKMRDRFF